MKIVAKPIDMVAWFDREGKLNPIRFRLENNDGSNTVIKIDKIITIDIEKLAGNPMFLFNCKSLINGIERDYQIKFELGTCRWILFRI